MRTVKERLRLIPKNPVYKSGAAEALEGYLTYKGAEFKRRYLRQNQEIKDKMKYEILSVLGYVRGTGRRIPDDHEKTDRYDEADVKYIMGPGNWEYVMRNQLKKQDKGLLCNNRWGCAYKPENKANAEHCHYGQQCDVDGVADQFGSVWKLSGIDHPAQTDFFGRPVDWQGMPATGGMIPLTDKQWGSLKRPDLHWRGDWKPLFSQAKDIEERWYKKAGWRHPKPFHHWNKPPQAVDPEKIIKALKEQGWLK